MWIPGIQLASGVIVTRENAHTSGVGEILDRSENIFQNVCSSERHFLLAKFSLNCCLYNVLIFFLAECWWSWWRRCRRWRWTRRSLDASGGRSSRNSRSSHVVEAKTLGFLRAIVLFNPDVKGLKEISRYFNLFCLFFCFPLTSACSSMCFLLGWNNFENEFTPASKSTPGKLTLHAAGVQYKVN